MSKASHEPKVSVITPLYNSSVFIRETLDSLFAQTYTNWESILVDDGSTDDTAQVIEPYLADGRVAYIRQENQGIAGARNTGIRAATGEWICLLDHDDRWLPDKLEKQIRFARAHGCDIVCTDAFIAEESEQWFYSRGFRDVAAKVQQSLKDESIDVFEQLIKLNFMCTCSVMLRKSLFDTRGLLDPKAVPADDYEMWLRCMPEAKIGFLGEPLVEYRVHEGNYSKNEVRMFEKIFYVLRKHRQRYAGDRRRTRQFDEALAAQYGLLFTKLKDRGAYGDVARHAFPLLTEGWSGVRVFWKTLVTPFLTRLVNSIQHRLGLTRM